MKGEIEMKVLYVNYRIGHHTFTVKYIKHKNYTRFKIMPWHMSPLTNWERIKEKFQYPTYTSGKWSSKTSFVDLEDKMLCHAAAYFKTKN